MDYRWGYITVMLRKSFGDYLCGLSGEEGGLSIGTGSLPAINGTMAWRLRQISSAACCLWAMWSQWQSHNPSWPNTSGSDNTGSGPGAHCPWLRPGTPGDCHYQVWIWGLPSPGSHPPCLSARVGCSPGSLCSWCMAHRTAECWPKVPSWPVSVPCCMNWPPCRTGSFWYCLIPSHPWLDYSADTGCPQLLPGWG